MVPLWPPAMLALPSLFVILLDSNALKGAFPCILLYVLLFIPRACRSVLRFVFYVSRGPPMCFLTYVTHAFLFRLALQFEPHTHLISVPLTFRVFHHILALFSYIPLNVHVFRCAERIISPRGFCHLTSVGCLVCPYTLHSTVYFSLIPRALTSVFGSFADVLHYTYNRVFHDRSSQRYPLTRRNLRSLISLQLIKLSLGTTRFPFFIFRYPE